MHLKIISIFFSKLTVLEVKKVLFLSLYPNENFACAHAVTFLSASYGKSIHSKKSVQLIGVVIFLLWHNKHYTQMITESQNKLECSLNILLNVIYYILAVALFLILYTFFRINVTVTFLICVDRISFKNNIFKLSFF